MKKLKLYQYTYCPYCRAAREKLEALGLDYEKIDVDRDNKPDIVKDNGGFVPVLVDGNTVINVGEESEVEEAVKPITDYLEKNYGRGRVEQWSR